MTTNKARQAPTKALAHPSDAKAASEATWLVEGMLVGGDDEKLEIVVTPYLFALERQAILEVEELPEPPLLIHGSGKAVRLRFRAGVRLFGLSSSTDAEARMWCRRSSFAVATRSAPPETTELTMEQRAETHAFLARHGIDDEVEDESDDRHR